MLIASFIRGERDCILIASLIRWEREGTRAAEDDEVDRDQAWRVQLQCGNCRVRGQRRVAAGAL